MKKKNREGITPAKTLRFFHCLLGGTRTADAYLDHFVDIDPEQLQSLTRKQITSLLLDVDACLAPIYRDILPENLEKIIELLRTGIKIGVYSNCPGMERLQPLHDLNIPIYSGAIPKPDPRGFLEVCDLFGFDPETTWMVGDNPSTDGGAVDTLGGMILIKPIPDGNLDFLPLRKLLLVKSRNALRSIGIAATLIDNRHIIRSSDLKISALLFL